MGFREEIQEENDRWNKTPADYYNEGIDAVINLILNQRDRTSNAVRTAIDNSEDGKTEGLRIARNDLVKLIIEAGKLKRGS